MTPSGHGGSLTGTTAFVSGSSRGIGRVVALALAESGCSVAVHGRSASTAGEVAAELAREGKHAGTFLGDLSQAGGAAQLADEVLAALPALDIFVAVAGADVLTGPAAHHSFEQKLESLLTVDVLGTITMARRIGAAMHARGRGAIVTIGWDQAEVGMEGDSGQLFAATKGAVMAFTRSLARSLGPAVRVNTVAPGWIRTAWGEQASEVWQRRARREAMLGRWGEPADVAAAVTWLVSPEASWVTGQVLPVNGGFRRAPFPEARAVEHSDRGTPS
ncbi:MAG: SDR family NAD(P)-dependent oxidoreductase [Pirellulales bacterium]|jgi:3-oxoacyl-[acyl-carrier protein] reductase